MKTLTRSRQAEVNAIRRAVKILGGQQALADLITHHEGRDVPLTQGAVSKWCTGAVRLPGEYVLSIEEWTGERVTRHQLRRDLYPWAAAHAGPRK